MWTRIPSAVYGLTGASILPCGGFKALADTPINFVSVDRLSDGHDL